MKKKTTVNKRKHSGLQIPASLSPEKIEKVLEHAAENFKGFDVELSAVYTKLVELALLWDRIHTGEESGIGLKLIHAASSVSQIRQELYPGKATNG